MAPDTVTASSARLLSRVFEAVAYDVRVQVSGTPSATMSLVLVRLAWSGSPTVVLVAVRHDPSALSALDVVTVRVAE